MVFCRFGLVFILRGFIGWLVGFFHLFGLFVLGFLVFGWFLVCLFFFF